MREAAGAGGEAVCEVADAGLLGQVHGRLREAVEAVCSHARGGGGRR